MSMLKKKGVTLRRYIALKGLFVRIPIPDYMKEVEDCITLGRSILDRHVLDSMVDESSRTWFNVDCEDFKTICYISWLDPELVVKRFEKTYERLMAGEKIDMILKEIEDE